MAATELSGQAATPRQRGALAAAFVASNASVWALTLLIAAGVAVAGPGAASFARSVLALRLTPTAAPSIGHALAIAAHNIPIAAWPMLLAPIGATRSRRGRAIGDALVGACLLANTLPVGAAFAAYGTRLLPYVPQLPLEWAGLAGGPAWWIVVSRGAKGSRRAAAGWFLLAVALMGAAAFVETWVVPQH